MARGPQVRGSALTPPGVPCHLLGLLGPVLGCILTPLVHVLAPRAGLSLHRAIWAQNLHIWAQRGSSLDPQEVPKAVTRDCLGLVPKGSTSTWLTLAQGLGLKGLSLRGEVPPPPCHHWSHPGATAGLCSVPVGDRSKQGASGRCRRSLPSGPCDCPRPQCALLLEATAL